MTAVLTPEAMERIDAMHREQTARLAAQGHHLTVERDYLTHGWIVRDPRVRGSVEIVTDSGACSCRRHRTWGRCTHSARVDELYGTTLTLMEGGKE